ncbi:MAG: AglZ/HisF2 family acetamidino modification protein [Cytophagaceae bacterium]|nr:AglZ/HisF2 family acetamidino modification protein [Cytophagaceae bacterium]
MHQIRVIPVLLAKNKGLVKTIQFKNPTYVGDPINAVKIFNEKEVDELILLNIDASREQKSPDLAFIKSIASECFMPLCYGGGIKTIDDIRNILKAGVEKVSINTTALSNPLFIKEASTLFGSSTIVVSIDYKKNWMGKYMLVAAGKTFNIHPVDFAKKMEEMGAGELLINAVNRDGTMSGYHLELIKTIAQSVSIPVIACGGAGSIADFKDAIIQANISAVAAGSMFVFKGKHRAVLINYPSQEILKKEVYQYKNE